PCSTKINEAGSGTDIKATRNCSRRLVQDASSAWELSGADHQIDKQVSGPKRSRCHTRAISYKVLLSRTRVRWSTVADRPARFRAPEWRTRTRARDARARGR